MNNNTNPIGTYINGNYTVTIYEDGTKIRENDLDNLTPSFAENCDIKITDKCDGGCEYCLTDSNLITMDKNEKLAINAINVGDYVLSYNINKNQYEIKPVVNISKRFYKGNLIKLQFENNKTILCTPNHKVFTSNRGYICAEELTTEDDFIFIDGDD